MERSRRRRALGALFFVIFVTSSHAVESNRKVVGTLNGSSQELDPAAIMVSAQWHLILNLGITLVGYDQDSRFVGMAAKSWTINQDSTEFEFVLRDNLRDSNGTPLDSADWRATFIHLLEKKGSTHSFVSEYLTEDGIITPSKTQLKLRLKKPYKTFLQRLATPEFILVPRAAIDSKGNVDLRISSGGYSVQKLDRQRGITYLKANRHFYEYSPEQPQEVEVRPGAESAKAALDSLISGKWNFMILLTPPTDSASEVLDAAVKNNKIRISDNELSGVAFVLLRDKGKLKDVNSRLALSAKISKVSERLHGPTSVKAFQMYPPGFLGAIPKADELKIWAAIESGGASGKPPAALKGYASSGVHSFGVPRWLKKALEPLGISISVSEMPHDQYVDGHKELDHDFSIIMTGMNAKDPAGSLLTLLGPKSGVIADPTGDLAKNLELASQNEGEARAKYLQFVSEQMLKRGLVVPLFHYTSSIATSSDLSAAPVGKFNYDLHFHRLRWSKK